ncbi:hypothetical protein GGG16DRAFT_111122 [Schizophyllum commune]|nr:hypothetical protein K525DRAFT_266291 [Schizophyllum commune Loenen D]
MARTNPTARPVARDSGHSPSLATGTSSVPSDPATSTSTSAASPALDGAAAQPTTSDNSDGLKLLKFDYTPEGIPISRQILTSKELYAIQFLTRAKRTGPMVFIQPRPGLWPPPGEQGEDGDHNSDGTQ